MSVPQNVMAALEIPAEPRDAAQASGRTAEKKKRQVWRACLPCRMLKLSCDSQRPCTRCVNRGITRDCTTWDEGARRACLPCQKSKFKCDRGRPCSRCLKRGTCEECIDWQEELRLVREAGGWKGAAGAQEARSRVALVKPMNPVTFRNKTMVFQSEMTAMCSTCLKGSDLVHTVLHRYSDMGHSLENLLSLIASLPARTQQLLEEIAELSVKSHQRLLRQRASVAGMEDKVAPLPVPQTDGRELTEEEEIAFWDDVSGRSRVDLCSLLLKSQQYRGPECGLHVDFCAQNEDVGYLRVELDSKTMKRRSLYLNKRFAGFQGVHQEELLARMASGDLLATTPEFDIVKNILLDLTQGIEGKTHYTKYMSCSQGHGCKMIRVDIQLCPTPQGMIKRVLLFWRMIERHECFSNPAEIIQYGGPGLTIGGLASCSEGLRSIQEFEECIQHRIMQVFEAHPDLLSDLKDGSEARPAKRRMLQAMVKGVPDSIVRDTTSTNSCCSTHSGSSTDGSRGQSPGLLDVSTFSQMSPPRMASSEESEWQKSDTTSSSHRRIKHDPAQDAWDYFSPDEKSQEGWLEHAPVRNSPSQLFQYKPVESKPVLQSTWKTTLYPLQYESCATEFGNIQRLNGNRLQYSDASTSEGDALTHVPFEEKPLCDEIAITLIQAGW